MSIVLSMHTETVPCLTVPVAHGTVIHAAVVMDLEMLFHVSNVNCHFIAQQALNTLDSCQLPGVV